MATNETALDERADGGCPVLPGYNPLDPDELRDPFPSYARARAEAPVFYSEELGFWSVTRREDVLAIIRDTERFSNRMAIPMPEPPERMRDRMPKYPFATALLFLDDPEHKVARKMVQAPFTPRRLRQMEPMIRERAEELLRLDDPNRSLDFVNDYAVPLALVVIGDIIGVPEEDFPLLEQSIEGAFRIASGVCTPEEIDELAEGQLQYWEYLCSIVEDRRHSPKDDFASVLSEYRNEDGTAPTTDEIAAHINTILGAGFETSAQMMTFGMQAILEHRDQWELLKSDRSLLPRAVEECVRYRTVIKRNFRVTNCDVEIAGVRIPEGSLVAIMNACANRDESAFPDPDRFDITREVDNLTFGRGKHYCLGAPLSKLEMRVTLEAFMDMAPEARVIEGQELRHKEDLRIDGLAALELDLGPVPSRAAQPHATSV
jgi:cytochrome P450